VPGVLVFANPEPVTPTGLKEFPVPSTEPPEAAAYHCKFAAVGAPVNKVAPAGPENVQSYVPVAPLE
jgi:hypothetical protein